MYHILKENLEIIADPEKKNISWGLDDDDANFIYIHNPGELLNAFNNLSLIPQVQTLVNSIKKYIDTSESTLLKIYQKSALDFERIRFQIIDIVQSVLFFYDSATPSSNNMINGFDVKMPQTNDFSEFIKNISDFNKVLNQCPYLKTENEAIKFNKTDSGSVWFEFLVEHIGEAVGIASGATFVVHNLAKIVDKCVQIKSHRITCRQQEELVRKASIENDFLEDILEKNEKLLNVITLKLTDELMDEFEKPLSEINDENYEHILNERRISLKFCLESLTSLMEKGMEIYASIDAPKEVKDLFPASEELKSFPEQQKRLEESIEDDE